MLLKYGLTFIDSMKGPINYLPWKNSKKSKIGKTDFTKIMVAEKRAGTS